MQTSGLPRLGLSRGGARSSVGPRPVERALPTAASPASCVISRRDPPAASRRRAGARGASVGPQPAGSPQRRSGSQARPQHRLLISGWGILTRIMFPIVAFKALPSPFSQIAFFSFVPASQAPRLLANSCPSGPPEMSPPQVFQPLPCPSSNMSRCLLCAPQKCLQTARALKVVRDKLLYILLVPVYLPGTIF